jgi:hypothetical protein
MMLLPPVAVRGCFQLLLAVAAPRAADSSFRMPIRQLVSQLGLTGSSSSRSPKQIGISSPSSITAQLSGAAGGISSSAALCGGGDTGGSSSSSSNVQLALPGPSCGGKAGRWSLEGGWQCCYCWWHRGQCRHTCRL